MKELPILFSAPMVCAILEGRKTQTRRIVKQKHVQFIENIGLNFLDGKWNQRPLPYGQPGDRLWVRERFLVHRPFTGDIDHDLGKAHVMYYADDNPRYRDKDKWKPSIHMPRWASRITLEITGIRVERLQDISESDALAEGIYEDAGGKFQKSKGNGPYCETARQAYQFLWQDINGAESWAANPWVWVIEFKKC